MNRKLVSTNVGKISDSPKVNLKKLKIMSFASELVAPGWLTKTGGLGDVNTFLNKAFRDLGHDARLVLPLYPQIPLSALDKFHAKFNMSVPMGNARYDAVILEGVMPGTDVPLYLIQNEDLFGSKKAGLYGDKSGDYGDNDKRYLFFAKATFQMMQKMGWTPDVIQAHDWQGALAPVIKNQYQGFGNTKTALTIHNLAFQGLFNPSIMGDANLPASDYSPEMYEYYNYFSYLKAGILKSDVVTTVSKNYASEILTPHAGAGFDGILNANKEKLHGIVNGGGAEWNPSEDKTIYQNYTSDNVTEGKIANKQGLLNEMGLEYDADAPLYGFVGRLTFQKGVEFIIQGMDDFLANNKGQLVVLGTGDEKYHEQLRQLEAKYPGRVKINIAYDEKIAHKIIASSDFFLMPSQDEPCGLTQIYSKLYGTLPIVSPVGGLDDTVENIDENKLSGTGFKMDGVNLDSFKAMLYKSAAFYQNDEGMLKVRQNAMASDHSWENSAQQYLDLFGGLFSNPE